MNVAKASIDVPLGMSDTQVTWSDFEGFHTFLLDASPESFDEACLRVAAKLGRGPREWTQIEIVTSWGILNQWRGPAQEQGTSLVKMEPLENGDTRLRIEISGIVHGGIEASPQAILRVSERLQTDLQTYCRMVRDKLAKLAESSESQLDDPTL